MNLDPALLFAFAVALAFFAGQQLKLPFTRRAHRRGPWPARKGGLQPGAANLRAVETPTRPAIADGPEQLRIVSEAKFEIQPLLNKGEVRWLYTAEKFVADRNLGWRVMAQVSLGEILSTPDKAAYAAINSKRADLLIVDQRGHALAAIEHQGEGHYTSSTTAARDAVKREALRKAGVRFIEMTPEHAPEDLARELARLTS
ncbi:DUF2726 domain-containing protein [Phenylobacterium deserti]|uniref:DUF2726 domain-containing protein n=1 Tax=Phenylobacterium deserti TaxID=1914756 RepID=A0A328APT2_9CAUL|nr:DUF2726 domain-containing protein [Phenylobacterium deserti]RAK57023.1 hypothetical protein DJ018_03420 [Phenylobacterium deserti]